MVAVHERQDASHAYQDAYEAVRILSSKWVLAVLVELARRPRSHNDLARATGLIEHKPLDRALRQLRESRLVDRTVHNVKGSAPRVRYQLTNTGRSLLPIVDELAIWWQTLDSNAAAPDLGYGY